MGEANERKQQDTEVILHDHELSQLAQHLRHMPYVYIDSTYRERGRQQVLNAILTCKQRKEITNMEACKTTFLQDSNVNTHYVEQDPDIKHIRNDLELALLALQLRQSSPAVVIDPGFRATLRGKIQAIVQSGQPCSSSTLSSSQTNSKHVDRGNEDDFSYIAQNIVKLPEIEQKAVLIDLAKQIRSDTDKRSIQKALSDRGIQLEEYQELPQFDNYIVIYAYKLLKGFFLSEI